MQKKRNSFLVVGSDGLIGNALIETLRCRGRVTATTRRADTVGSGKMFLDLAATKQVKNLRGPYDVVFICAGESSLTRCEEDPLTTRRVNVEGVVLLIDHLVGEGSFIVYLSSARVFDGHKCCALADDPFSPTTEYGRQKVEVEHRASLWASQTAIVRLGKVWGNHQSLFSEWAKRLRMGRPIEPFSDMWVAPITVTFASKLLLRIAEIRRSGVFQVSGNHEVSYADIALRLADLLGADRSLVRSVKASDIKGQQFFLSEHVLLDSTSVLQKLEMEVPDVNTTIDNILMSVVKQGCLP